MLGLCNPKQCKLFCYCALCFVVAFYTIFSFETQHSVSQNLRTYTHGVETDEQTSGPPDALVAPDVPDVIDTTERVGRNGWASCAGVTDAPVLTFKRV